MRNKIIHDTKIIKILDFGNFMVFDSAAIQTMVFLISKSSENANYSFKLRKSKNSKASFKTIVNLLSGIKTLDNEFLNPQISKTCLLN